MQTLIELVPELDLLPLTGPTVTGLPTDEISLISDGVPEPLDAPTWWSGKYFRDPTAPITQETRLVALQLDTGPHSGLAMIAEVEGFDAVVEVIS
jgi:hypothetical protein